jgi:hypothetical protein
MNAGCPGAWAGAHLLRDTQGLCRDLDRPARVPAAREAFQAKTGPADRETLTADER